MPKGVFWLFWDYLKSGRQVGAFVKNKSKTGEHYWLFATASPVEGGYVSVPIKPSGPLLERVQKIYADLLAQETSDGLTPEKSAETLIERLKQEGFKTYEAFMSHAIADQTNRRRRAIEGPSDQIVGCLFRAQQHWKIVEEEMHNTINSFKVFEKLPVNMRIQAARLGADGIPLSVIATNFGKMTDSIEEMTNDFLVEGDALSRNLQHGLFLNAAKIELTNGFSETEAQEGMDLDAEKERMAKLNRANAAEAMDGVKQIAEKADEFSDIFASVETFHSGISVTRVMAEIEIGQVDSLAASSLSAIVEDLNGFLTSEGERLSRMRTSLNRIRIEARKALTEMRRRANKGLRRPVLAPSSVAEDQEVEEAPEAEKLKAEGA